MQNNATSSSDAATASNAALSNHNPAPELNFTQSDIDREKQTMGEATSNPVLNDIHTIRNRSCEADMTIAG